MAKDIKKSNQEYIQNKMQEIAMLKRQQEQDLIQAEILLNQAEILAKLNQLGV